MFLQVIAVVSDSRKVMSCCQMTKTWMIAVAYLHINSSVTV